MSNDAAKHLMIFSAEALTTAFLLLGLFRMRSRLGLSPLYVTLGVFQPIQVLLASSIYVEILPGLVISPGSVIMFTASLFAVLLVYIREDAIEARKVIYGIMVANLTMTLLLLVFGVQLGFPDTLNFLGLPREIFNQGARVMLTGTIALFGDVILVIFVYEAVRRFIPRIPFLRIYLTMAIILTFDTLVFATGAFYGQPNYRSIVLAGIVGKVGMAAFYAAALTIYLRFMEPADRVSSAAAQPFRDIFYALTYREKYEIERDRAEEVLRESEARYRELAGSIADVFFAMDRDLRFTYWNQASEELTGMPAGDVVGKTFYEVYPEARGTTAEELYLKTLGTQQPQTAVQESALGGEHYFFEIRAYPSRRGLSVFLRDITERKQAEEEIHRRAGELAALYDASQVFAHSLDPEVIGQRLIETMERLLSYECGAVLVVDEATQELVPLALSDQGRGPDFVAQDKEYVHSRRQHVGEGIIGWVAQHGQTVRLGDVRQDPRYFAMREDIRSELCVPLIVGEQVIGALNVETSKADAYDENDERLLTALAGPAAVTIENARLYDQIRKHAATLEQRVAERTVELNQRVAEVEHLNRATTNLLRDLQAANRKLGEAGQELQRINVELRIARDRAQDADRLKSAFLATMSHELRTPLNSIIGFTGIMLQGIVGPLNDEQTKQLIMVQSSARHLLALINDVLDISKIEAGQLDIYSKPFDMREAIEKVVQTASPLAEKKGLALTTEVAPEVGRISSDRRRVEQILLNLLNNAVKFTKKGEVRIESEVSGDWLVTRVVDTGIGIRPEDMEVLFEPFQQVDSGLTRQYEGTGLGLSICKRLVEMLGGEIWAESEGEGKGSTFTFTLPVG